MLSATQAQTHRFFPEIQGLRAIAVLLVLVFHLNPHWIRGGFVGVDVFFVISGFVITQSLLREMERDNNISLSMFYVRRVRRLLPAAAIVLGFVLLGTFLYLPAGQWAQVTKEVIASALYVENWALFFDATNYLAQEEADSPIVHFWSLSIEEQFYFIWPFLILLVIKLVPPKRRRSTLALVLAGLTIVSFTYSIVFTIQAPGQAYVSTFTRLWELTAGALLSCAIWRPSKILAIILGILGLSMIVWSGLSYSEDILFPGYTAILPVGGAVALVLAITSEQAERFFRPLQAKPMLYFGNISYSLYLWHWPIIVFSVSIAGRALNVLELVGVAALSIVAATISTYLLEDPFRKGRFKLVKRPAALTLAVAAIAAPSLSAYFMSQSVNQDFDPTLTTGLLGAAAIGTPNAYDYNSTLFQPRPELARKDLPIVYSTNCHASINEIEVIACEFGNSQSKTHIAIVGDSHAAQWVPALKEICETKGCRVTSITKSSCPYVGVDIITGKPGDWYQECTKWNNAMLTKLKELKVDVLMPTLSRIYRVRDQDTRQDWINALSNSLAKTWNEVEAAGIKVLPIADTPRLPKIMADCLVKNKNDAKDCTYKLSELRLSDDPVILASSKLNIDLIDINYAICPDGVCEPIIGNVLVWRDTNHITASYARTLTPTLYKEMRELKILH